MVVDEIDDVPGERENIKTKAKSGKMFVNKSELQASISEKFLSQ